MLFEENAWVMVIESKIGFRGVGQIVCLLFGSNYLVRVEIENKARCIRVNAKHLRHSTVPTKEKTNGQQR